MPPIRQRHRDLVKHGVLGYLDPGGQGAQAVQDGAPRRVDRLFQMAFDGYRSCAQLAATGQHAVDEHARRPQAWWSHRGHHT